MKKTLLSLIFLAPLAVHAVDNDSVNLNFTGTLIAPTCTAKFENASATYEIDFGNVKSSDVLASASRSGYLINNTTTKKITVKFTACGASTKFRAKMTTTKNNSAGASFKNRSLVLYTAATTPLATGLGVAFFNTDANTSNSNALLTDGTANEVSFNSSTITGNVSSGYVWPLYAGLIVTDSTKLTEANIGTFAGTTLKTNATIGIDYL